MLGYTSAFGQGPRLQTAPSRTYTAEQQAYMSADRQAAGICSRAMLAQTGRRPLITDPNYLACVKQARDLILGGKTPEEVEAMVRGGGAPAAQAGMGTNWLMWGGIAAGVLVVGYLVFFRK